LSKEGFETFSVYGFSIDYPAVCRVEFNPKSRREAGDIVFHFPDREKLYLSWGKLENAQKKFSSVEEQAENSLKSVKKSSKVKNFDKVTQDSVEINSHKAAYNRVRMDEVPASFFSSKKTTKREVLSLHVHCEPAARYYVIYSLLSPSAPEDFSDLFLDMVHSFKCHWTEG
jgi:hypothetical protein